MRSRDLEPSPGHTAPRPPLACIPSARHINHWPSRLMTPRPSRLTTPRPSRLMTPRPSRPHLGPGHSTSDHNAASAAPLCQLWTCQNKGTKVAGTRGTSRRLVETAAGAYAPTPPARASTSRSAPSPARTSTLRSAPSQAPRERAPNATSQRRWGGSNPNHPAALCSRMQMGFKHPEQHRTTYSQASGRGSKFGTHCKTQDGPICQDHCWSWSHLE
jgi:hypothetical protein